MTHQSSAKLRTESDRTGPIVIIINSFHSGGAERLVIDDIHDMLARGMDVRVITVYPEKASDTFEHELHMPKEWRRSVFFRGVYDVAALFRLVRLLRRWKPYAVVTHLWIANTVGRIAAILAGVRTIIAFEHNVYDSIKSRRHFIADRILAMFTDCIIAVSESVKDSLVRHGIPADKITAFHGGFDFGPYRSVSKPDARRQHGILPGEFVFLFLGRLVPQKTLGILLRAFARLNSGKLFIVGGGESLQDLQNLARELGISSRVTFTGFYRGNPASFYAMADCFVLPSRWEGMPIVIPEAMASNLPVIASRVGGIPELVTDGKNGLLVESGNIEALDRAMKRMMTDGELRNRLSRQGSIDAEEYNISKHVDKMLEVIREHSKKEDR